MAQYRDRGVDSDLRKGAVESAFDWSAPGRDEEGRSHHAIAVTEDVLSADSNDIAEVEHELGADEDGTPG